MSTPFVHKTTISSRNRATLGPNDGHQAESLASQTGGKTRATMGPPSSRPSLIARNRALKTPGPAPQAASTISRPHNHAQSTTSTTSRLPPHTTAKAGKTPFAKVPAIVSSSTASRIVAPRSRLNGVTPAFSRTSSIVSSVSSKPPTEGAQQHSITSNHHIPETNTVRKGLAKFSNPIECQRQFQALSLKVRQRDEIVEAREKEIDKLQEQLKGAIDMGVGYATVVQYFAVKLKLDSETDLLSECEHLKSRVSELVVNEREYDNKLGAIVEDYKNHLKVEHDLRGNIERELEETREHHSQLLERLKSSHKNELDDLNQKHSAVEEELRGRIEVLESELETKCKDLSDLRKEHEVLSNSFNKLEESLTKDKDARVKYAQEKISQLQKDVESLNSVLEMRLERVHALEKDSIMLSEAQSELITQKDANKALQQQLESVKAALERRREQFETLIADHEKLRQELKRERKERRRMTMRTEQLEYVLNESCASESNMVFNSSIRDLDSADHIV